MKFKFQGDKYDDSLGIKDIAKLIRKELKEKYPKCKFSVRIQRYAQGQSMSIALVESSFNPFAEPSLEVVDNPQKLRGIYTPKELLQHWKNEIENGSHSINQFYIDDDYKLNDMGKQLAHDMNNAAKQYNFDDSDSMTDYFHVNFYYNIEIGKWDKKLIITS